MHPKILIYRHDDVVEALMADFLVFCNYEVWPAYCREDALLDIKDQDFDIAIFDLTTLEDLELIQAAQSVKPELVILALTDEHDSTLVKEASLSADQTLVTPLPLVKILRRIKTLLEKKEADKLNSREPIIYGSLYIDIPNVQARCGSVELNLTQTEFTLLMLLTQQADTAVSKDEIYPKVLGRPRGQYDRAIDVHISSVRHKLQQAGCQDIVIESVRGVGYKLKKSF